MLNKLLNKNISFQEETQSEPTNSFIQSGSTQCFLDSEQHQLDITDRSSISQGKKTKQFLNLVPGSLQQSIFTLISTIMGTGLLTLPSNASMIGIILSSMIITIAALLCYISMQLLMACSIQKLAFSYSHLVEIGFRSYKLRLLFQIMMIVFCWGCMVAIAGFVVNCFYNFGKNDVYDNGDQGQTMSTTGNLIRIIANVIVMVLILPLGLLKNLSSLRYVNVISFFMWIYILMVVIIDFFSNIDIVQQQSQSIKLFVFDINIFVVLANTIYTFICHQSLFPIIQEWKQPTLEKSKKMSQRSIIYVTLFYLSLSIFSYLRLGSTTSSLVLDSYQSSQFIFAKIALIIILFFSLPLLINPARTTFKELIGQPENQISSKSRLRHIVITIGLLFSSGCLAILYPQAKNIFSLLGGTLGTCIAFTIPGFLFYKVFNNSLTLKIKIILVTSTIMITVFGFLGAILSII